MAERKAAAYRNIFITLIILAVLTAVEYWVGVAYPSTVLLIILAVLKAAIIVWNFMHIYRLWRVDEEGH